MTTGDPDARSTALRPVAASSSRTPPAPVLRARPGPVPGARATLAAGNPLRWRLWRAPRRVIAYVLAVDVVAVVLAAALGAAEPVATADLRIWALLALGCAVHIEAARGIERRRQAESEGRPYIELKSMWSFAGLLLLPLGLALALVVFTFAYWWLRVSHRPVPHRWTFSAATVVIASCAAWAVLSLGPDHAAAGVVAGPLGLAVVSAAALTRWLVNHGLVVGVISLSAPETPWRQRLGSPTDMLIGLGALALGVALAVLGVAAPWLVPVLLVPVMGMHRGFLLEQFARAAHTDTKTGLANAPHWQDLAVKELARARRRGWGLGVLMVDLDEFKVINDRHGHLVGDLVLRSVADCLRDEVRAYDAVGRFGGEEFVVLLAEVGPDEVARTAERVRRRVSECEVPRRGRAGPELVRGLTASIGAASYPQAADDLHGLVSAADAALYLAKRGGRNRVELAVR